MLVTVSLEAAVLQCMLFVERFEELSKVCMHECKISYAFYIFNLKLYSLPQQ